MQLINLNEKRIKDLLTLIVCFILVVILAEVFLRIFLPQKIYNACYEKYYEDGPGLEVKLDEHLGWRLKENYSSCGYNPETNNIIKISHNSKGIRLEKEIDYDKGNKTRIMLLGDSFVYGMDLDDKETIATNLQKLLDETYEVIPLASVGYGTDQELLILKEEGLKYQPDIVILFFYQNDFSNSISTTQNYASKPMFLLQNNNSLKLINYPTKMFWQDNFGPNILPLNKKEPINAFFLRFSHLYSLYYHKISIVKESFSNNKKDYLSAYKDSEQLSIEQKYDSVMLYSMKTVLSLFIEFKKLSKENNFKFIIINIPSSTNVNSRCQKQFLNQHYNVDESFFEFSKVSKIFTENIPKLDITYLDLTKLARSDLDRFYTNKCGHWSPKAVSLTADYIYEELKKQKTI